MNMRPPTGDVKAQKRRPAGTECRAMIGGDLRPRLDPPDKLVARHAGVSKIDPAQIGGINRHRFDPVNLVNAVFKDTPVFCQIQQKRLQPRITGTPCGLRHHHAKPVK